MIKGSVQQEDLMVLSIYTSNTETLEYIRQRETDMKGVQLMVLQ